MNIKELEAVVLQQAEQISTLQQAVDQLQSGQSAMHDDLMNAKSKAYATAEEADVRWTSTVEFVARLDTVEALCNEMLPKVNSTNKSAPVKRNMTDADAIRAMTGDAKDMSHKDAGEFLGITYAQVYSCRKEFTFKHVHKELRDAKWVNPWA